MIRRMLRGLSNRALWRRTKVGEVDVETNLRGGAAAQAGALPDASPLGSGFERGVAGVWMQNDVEEIDRFVNLTFVALLRRKPDRDTLLAYREGFTNGTTFHDLIDDIIESDEYRSVQQRVRQRRTASAQALETSPGPGRRDDLPTTVALLTTRLVDKGWQPQISAIAKADRGDDVDRRRMRSLRVTLSVLDRL